MALFLLIRHGNTDMVGRALAGRMPGVHLNDDGRSQVRELVDCLAKFPISCICSSPLERALETAGPIAESKDLTVEIRHGLNEVDVGEWTGLDFARLEPVEMWRRFNLFRTGTRIPGGEHIFEVQARMVAEVESLRKQFPDGTIALVSHADPLKTVIAHYNGIKLDSWDRISVDTGSLSLLKVDERRSCLHCLNHRGKLLPQNPA